MVKMQVLCNVYIRYTRSDVIQVYTSAIWHGNLSFTERTNLCKPGRMRMLRLCVCARAYVNMHAYVNAEAHIMSSANE